MMSRLTRCRLIHVITESIIDPSGVFFLLIIVLVVTHFGAVSGFEIFLHITRARSLFSLVKLGGLFQVMSSYVLSIGYLYA